MEIKVDSAVTFSEALTQNPKSLAPQNILDTLAMASVQYWGFDGAVHQGQIVMRKDVMNDIEKFFALAFKLKFFIKSVIPVSNVRYGWNDEVSCDDNNTSCFNYRSISGNAAKLSKHALGLAFDVNPVQNIYIRYNQALQENFRFPSFGIYDPSSDGTLVVGDPLVSLMMGLGWDWGGNWTKESGRVDYQHFEKSC